MQKVYVASGWFTEEQEKARQEIIDELETLDANYYSPKDESSYDKLGDWNKVFQSNTKAIDECDIIIASTIGYDPGTIWEAGYGFAKGKTIIYYAPGIKKFNLMLAKSSTKVALNHLELRTMLKGYNKVYDGEIE